MFNNKQEKFQQSREAAKITFDKVSSWEELNAATLEEADKNFNKRIEETWKEFAVSGVLQFNKKEDKQVLQPFTDLDGRSALGILKESGIDISSLTFVRPGEFVEGAINLDTGDKFGVVYNESTYTAYFDHHTKGTKEVTSTAEIVYQTMAELGKLEKSEAMDRLVDFVTKIDNRQFPPEEFLKSAKTILGLQRDLDFNKLLAYFKDHESPTEELTPEEFEKYGLKDSAEKQQKTVDEAMETLKKMEGEGKVIDTKYGKIVVNENNELKVGASAAYVKFDGIINFTSEKSFAITFKEKDFNEEELKNKLGDKFQGKIIRGKMWIYNEQEPLVLKKEDLIKTLLNNPSRAIIERFGEMKIYGIHESDGGFVKGCISSIQRYRTMPEENFFVGACMTCGEEWQEKTFAHKGLSNDERRETTSFGVSEIPGVKRGDFSDEEIRRIDEEKLRVTACITAKNENESREQEFFQEEIIKCINEILSGTLISKNESNPYGPGLRFWWNKEIDHDGYKIIIECRGIKNIAVTMRKNSSRGELIGNFMDYQIEKMVGLDKLNKYKDLMKKKFEESKGK